MLTLDLLKLSAAVYLPTWPEVEAAIGPEWQLVYPLDIGDCEAMICRKGAEAVALAIRGTEFSRGDWNDISANVGRLRSWEGPGLLHSGYSGYTDMTWEPAREALAHLAGAPLYVTGHSLGGALACQFGAKNAVSSRGIQIEHIVTFGAPKCMDAVCAQWYPAPMTRYTIAGDFAPAWPWLSSFEQAGRRIVWQPDEWLKGPVRRHLLPTYQAAALNGRNRIVI